MHAMVGTSTQMITAAIIKERDTADLGQLPELLRITAQNFIIEEVLANKVYNTVNSQKAIAALGAHAYIPFKTNHAGETRRHLEGQADGVEREPGRVARLLRSTGAGRDRILDDEDADTDEVARKIAFLAQGSPGAGREDWDQRRADRPCHRHGQDSFFVM
jgi:hypothetical protein